MPIRTPRPPMGWNSWDCYGTTVTEAEVLANAQFMADHLLEHGWDTVVVDAGWFDPTARRHGYNPGAPLCVDGYGRLIPDSVRFPSSADGAGFAPLAEQVHALGLRFGIHIMRGVSRRAVERRCVVLGGGGATAGDIADDTNVCEWNPDNLGLNHAHPAAQAYYDSCAELFASWGVDFVKADDMLWPYQETDVEAIASALDRTGRPMALSLSPGRDMSLSRLEHVRGQATMWRVCDDVWDRWEDIEANFARLARWAPHAGDQGWPDGDMLPLGRIGIRAERGDPRDDGLTPAERRTLMTLWTIARSPLMIGGDLPATDPDTVALFTNPDVLDVHASSTGSREVFREGELVLWTAEGPAGARYVAAFNLGDQRKPVALDAANIGLPRILDGTVSELWTGDTVRTAPVTVQSDAARGVAPGSTGLFLTLDPHGAALLRYTPRSG
ncbi:glycoside hydrolase family 27 protein [Phytoactinopolyspora endophytica]|uniref:glycoside hydrolase family 27 protein n=1 Tax=Phytoactinopolyspora endophytica TaxID=1642495 RepID=UPI00197BAA61|nr:glycoside hydrolase family 27 protein [Phytoactinopolyspora endophytica]